MLTAEDLARIELHMRPDAWGLWQEVENHGVVLEVAHAEYRDARLVAAYALEVLCTKLRTQPTGQTSQIRRIKVGPIEIEKATSASESVSPAADLCARAAILRSEAGAPRAANPPAEFGDWRLR